MTNITLQDIELNVFSDNVNDSDNSNNTNDRIKQTNSVNIKNKANGGFLSMFKTILNLAIYPNI